MKTLTVFSCCRWLALTPSGGEKWEPSVYVFPCQYIAAPLPKLPQCLLSATHGNLAGWTSGDLGAAVDPRHVVRRPISVWIYPATLSITATVMGKIAAWCHCLHGWSHLLSQQVENNKLKAMQRKVGQSHMMSWQGELAFFGVDMD